MIALSLDTSSEVTSVALVSEDAVLCEREHRDARRHAEVLAELIDACLIESVDLVCCGVGPGPYTGLRAGIVSALALGLALDRPVYGICSLDALAQAVARSSPGGPFDVGIDARRKETYWGRYDADGRRLAGPHIAKDWQGYGMGDGRYPTAVDVGRLAIRAITSGEQPRPIEVPLAEHGTESGQTAAAIAHQTLLPARPLYIRRPDIT
jgi:tRNA threonylcarbamoyl adenosine modification protein YeaZ